MYNEDSASPKCGG
jgi:hypothetical protein